MISSSLRLGARIGLIAAMSAAATVALAPPASGSAAPTCPNNTDSETGLSVAQDINNDHVTDLAVGIPLATAGGEPEAGVVDVRYSVDKNAPRAPQRLDLEDFGLTPSAGDDFGATVAMTSLAGDGCTDLAIGVPGANRGAGLVIIAYGSGEGVRTDNAIVLRGKPGDDFGASIATDGKHLFIGAPGRTVSGAEGAGAIDQFDIDGTTATTGPSITQDSPNVLGGAERQDHFGDVLRFVANGRHVASYRTLLVGTPYEDVGTVADAGIVTVLQVGYGTKGVIRSSCTSQNSPGVGGGAEAHDRFGWAIDYDAEDRDEPTVAVGSPGEALGSKHNAGAVQLLSLRPGEPARQFAYITQDSPAVSGVTERDDRFGWSVLFGGFRPRTGTARPTFLAVGAPGEAIGSRYDAGAVSLLRIGHPSHKPRTVADAEPVLYQGDPRIGGTASVGAGFGTQLEALAIPARYDGNHKLIHNGGADLVIATPFDDRGETNAGTVTVHGWSHSQPVVVQDSAGATFYGRYGRPASTSQSTLTVQG